MTMPRDKAGRFLPVAERVKSWPTDQVLAAIEKNFGLKTQVARELGASLDTITRYGQEIEAVRQAFWAQDERINDMAELGLYNAIQKGEAWAICFRLKTRAKDRGYTERIETDNRHTGKDGGPIDVRVMQIEFTAPVLAEALAALTRAGALELLGAAQDSNGQKP